MDLQVLVASMNQQDFSLVDEMNIQTDAIIANQTAQNGFDKKVYDFGQVMMISTQTRGVGLNRNVALLASEADILLFSDDDMCYYDGALTGVKKAFSRNPSADVIIFSVDITQNGQIVERRYGRNRRAHIWNTMKFGTYAIAIRRKSLIKANLKFHESFGGGCPFSCGEDSLFIKTCFDRSLKVYTNEYVLGSRSKDSSSWFSGYTKKYVYDKGVLLSFLFPRLKYLLAVYYSYRLKNKASFSFEKTMKLMITGIKNAGNMETYAEHFK